MTIDQMTNLKTYTESNRIAWNEVMPRHQQAAKAKWDQAFSQLGYACIDRSEQDALTRIGIVGKDVAHLCCNNGVELLSLKNLGANRCVGFDISDEAIKEAMERAARSHIACRFVRLDVYEIGGEYAGQFDLVYITAGCVGWMPDLTRFFKQAAALLRPCGRVFIHEIHPVSEMLPFDSSEHAGQLKIIEPYCKHEPYIECGGLDYVGQSQYASTASNYWFAHTLSDIMMSLIRNGVAIEYFSEHAEDISAGHRLLEQANAGIPLSYLLIGKKAHTAQENDD